ncbi:Pre-mRNA-splicing factor ATP-dependent RNA helicase DHX15 [Pelomyxa schiedti]|nr:Pre-mRNA-splicing factor ATP-dependent RNA helicase DHX15 [Pelomyxa schiedti]
MWTDEILANFFAAYHPVSATITRRDNLQARGKVFFSNFQDMKAANHPMYFNGTFFSVEQLDRRKKRGVPALPKCSQVSVSKDTHSPLPSAKVHDTNISPLLPIPNVRDSAAESDKAREAPKQVNESIQGENQCLATKTTKPIVEITRHPLAKQTPQCTSRDQLVLQTNHSTALSKPPSFFSDNRPQPQAQPSNLPRKLTFAERQANRSKNPLPILNARAVFCSRLLREKVLVCVAETGSGKTTQLPQYCAEVLREYQHTGVVICTQPRLIAALSIAERVAREFDGRPPGLSVGYDAGGKITVGSEIMFCTDSAFVRRAAKDPLLKGVSAVIVDEAHERSLYTDLVLGICKQVKIQRPDDFFIVVASATIDESEFLSFLGCKTSSLKVPGRPYEIDVEYMPPAKQKDDNGHNDLTGNMLKLIQMHIVPTVIKKLCQKRDGHALVFLPGQGEVEQAIHEFEKQRPLAGKNWVALPLFGSLPPEEQQQVLSFEEKNPTSGKRMIVFCTNVAETSLTVPGVQLVFDSGFAKEAVYDPQRRLTVLELRYISQSSSEQRKGRAGRVCRGYCVRLHEKEAITRQSIQPEILRSSLDSVVLQLKRMNQDPLIFSYMTIPPLQTIKDSLIQMTHLQLLDSTGKITPRGRLVCNLEFEPRLASFVLLAASKHHDFLDTALGIAAILSAPGSIFFMGDKCDRALVQGKISFRAASFDSDLLFLHDTFLGWRQAGFNTKNGDCASCHKPANKGICHDCRVSFSLEYGLNNKVLKAVNRLQLHAGQTIEKWYAELPELAPSEKSTSTVNRPSHNSVALTLTIGELLASGFCDQVVEVLVPPLPEKGVRLVNLGIRANIERTSCPVQRRIPDPPRYYLGMKIMKLPNGKYFVDQLHPVTPHSLVKCNPSWCATHNIPSQPCLVKEWLNLSFGFEKFCAKHCLEGEGLSERWLSLHYDNSRNSLKLYCSSSVPFMNQRDIISLVEPCIKKEQSRLKAMTLHEIVGFGLARATFGEGMQVLNISMVSSEQQFKFNYLPNISGSKEFRSWLETVLHLSASEISWCKFEGRGKSGILLLSSSDNLAQTSQQIQATYSHWLNCQQEEHNVDNELTVICSSDSSGKQLRAITNKPLTQEQVSSAFPGCVQCSMNHETLTLKIFDLPGSVSKTTLSEILSDVGNIRIHTTPSKFSDDLICAFLSEMHSHQKESVQNALAKFMVPITANIRTRRGGTVTKQIVPKFNWLQEYTWIINFLSTWQAEHALAGDAHKKLFRFVSASTRVEISFPRLFNLPNLMTEINSRCDEQVKFHLNEFSSKTIVNISGSPSSCGKASNLLRAATSPMTLQVSERELQRFLMFSELTERRVLHQWAAGTLHLEIRIKPGKYQKAVVKVYGPVPSQSEFISKLGAYSSEFSSRFTVIPCNSVDCKSFHTGRAGAHVLLQMTSKYPHCLLRFYESPSLIVILAESHTQMTACRKETVDLLHSTCNIAEGCSTHCVGPGCSAASGIPLSMCGHYYCTDCLEQVTQSGDIPVCCAQCATPIVLGDLRDSLSKEAWKKACESSVAAYVKERPIPGIIECPTGCGSILPANAFYQECQGCSKGVCPVCRAVEEPSHFGRTCEDFQLFVHNFVTCPNGCRGFVDKNRSYHPCDSCGVDVCGMCNTSNALHLGRTCQQFQEYMSEHEINAKYIIPALPQVHTTSTDSEIKKVFTEATCWIRTNWSLDMPAITQIAHNPGLERNCRAMEKFLKAIGGNLGLHRHNTFFAWYGSDEDSILNTCEEGWTPRVLGEYFYLSSAASKANCKGGNFMLACLLLRGPFTRDIPQLGFRIINPMDSSLSYCLPVSVVVFGTYKTPLFKNTETDMPPSCSTGVPDSCVLL